MKYLHSIFWLTVFIVLFVFLQTQYAFHFFYVEQNQLFQNTWPYVSDHLFQIGGLASVLSEFLVQFFILPYMGALITSLLLTMSGFVLSLIVRRIAPKTDLFVLCLIPVISLFFISLDYIYRVSGTVAFLLMLSSFWGVLHIADSNKRLLVHALAIPALFCLAGPVYLLYVVMATLYELFQGKSISYLSLLLLAEAILIGTGCIYFQFSPAWRFVFLPDLYYDQKLIPPTVNYYSWIAAVFLIIFALFNKQREVTGKKAYISMGLQVILLFGFCLWGFPKYNNSKSYMAQELDYYSRTGQWDKILKRCEGKLTNYLYLCYLNIALLEKGELAEKMFYFDQRGPLGIMPDWNRLAHVSILLNDIYFVTNNIMPAQKLAFEALVGSSLSGNPRVMKRLVQTNLITGAYPVAEKYINILENTFYYKDWAKEHRRFLYDDKAVENDPLLGQKRKSLPEVNTLSQIEGLEKDLARIAEQNPSQKAAIEFLGGMCLLTKDMRPFEYVLTTYFGTDVLPALPKSFQEAVIALYESYPEKWAEYHIQQSIIDRYQEYKKQILAHKNNPGILPGLLNRSFGDTFWYYFMYK